MLYSRGDNTAVSRGGGNTVITVVSRGGNTVVSRDGDTVASRY